MAPLVVKSLASTSAIYGAPRERAADCAVFVAGLMAGRTPEYLGKNTSVRAISVSEQLI
jgi:hypothetical protein